MVTKPVSEPMELLAPEPVVAEFDDDLPTTEEILEDIRVSMKQALAGQTRPAREALAEIRRKIAADANPR